MKVERNQQLAIVALLATVALASPEMPTGQVVATGRWEGTIRRASSTLAIAVELPADSAGRGTFTAGDIGAMDVPLTNLRVGREVSWALVGDRSTLQFSGTLSRDSITGTVVEGDIRGTFGLHRVSSSTVKPYTASEIQGTNGGVVLAGTVLSPRTAGKHAAVVFIHGSGAEGRWANAYLADFLACHGVVTLIYDKRGVGASTGDWTTSTLDELAADARAMVRLLAARPDVDATRVGVYGHSQGGFIAPMIAARNPDVRWIIDADGNVGPQYEQDLYRVGTMLRKEYHGDTLRDALALYREFVDVARNGLAHDRLDADKAKHRSAQWFDELGIPDDANWIWRWYRGVGNANNRSAWASISVPVFLLYGERDEIVSTTESIAAITGILKASHDTQVTVRVLAGADHTLRLPAVDPHGWPHYAPGFPGVVLEWINKR